MLDGPRALGSSLHLLLLAERGKELLAIVNEEPIRPGDQSPAVKTIPLSLLCTYHLTATEAIVDELVTLRHAVALDPVQEDLAWTLLLLWRHSQRLLYMSYVYGDL